MSNFLLNNFKEQNYVQEYFEDEEESEEDIIQKEKDKNILNEMPIFKRNSINMEEIEENNKSDNSSYHSNETEMELEHRESEEQIKEVVINEKANETDLNESNINKNNIMESIIYAVEDNEDISKFESIKDLAIKFPFTLDEFQKRSIIRLENNENVLVCAHTSSGKTVVAEYGIALGKKHSKRVVYTSPIKALSNQKYREFKKKFNDVGILTGDVNINPDAQCLIMTTEILQSFLYKNSELLSQLEWIIFDEIHYINDNERGHVWEEILILLPPEINLIMLSATIPNYMEFAKWVGSIKKSIVYVEITKKRIVPLKHQIYLDSQNIYEVKSTNGTIYKHRIREALKNLNESNEGGSIRIKYGNKKADEQQMKNNIKYFMEREEKYYKKKFKNTYKNYNKDKLKITKMHHKIAEIVEYLQKNDLCPAVIFVFSIRRIIEYTRMLSSKKLLKDEEKDKITKFYNEVISSKISKEDQEIPQIKEVLEILKSGIGLHHAGLLPILKEIIELLYSQGLIKVLFATTSFSIGLNMPTRTVVFTDLYIFSENSKEILSSSEYLQMCGRAGRRGIDTIGNVYIILSVQERKNEDEEIFNMLEGEGTDVKSKLRLSYKTFLSFSSRDQNNMKIFVQASFLESRNTLSLPEKIRELNELEAKSEKLKFKCKYNKETIIKNRNNISIYKLRNLILENKNDNKGKKSKKFDIEDFPCKDYFSLNEEYKKCNKLFFGKEPIYKRLTKYNSGTILKVKNKKKFYPKFNEGKYVMLIHAYSANTETSYKNKLWCLGIEEYKRQKKIEYQEEEENDDFIGKGDSNIIKKYNQVDIFKDKNEYKGYTYFYEFYDYEEIINIYEYPYVKVNKITVKSTDGKYYCQLGKFFERILRELYNQIKEFFVEKNSKANKLDYDYSKYIENDIESKNILIKRREIKNNAKNILCYDCPKFERHITKFYEYKRNQDKIQEIYKDLNPENMAYFEEFKIRQNILKEMEYINEDNYLTLKGKAAREINTTDCLLITEILISDIFSKLNDGEVVAFLSGFATNKNQIEIDYPRISPNLNDAFEKFLKIYEKILKEEEKYKFKENKYNRRFMPDVSNSLKSWMEGASFGEICKLTDLEEGKLYSLILRIFLFLDEIFNFYSVLGNINECKRFEKIKNSLLRGIMGVQSLYLQDKINIDLN